MIVRVAEHALAGVRIITLADPSAPVHGGTTHVLVHDGRTALVDCHAAAVAGWLASAGLPLPELILHTHVQPEHCAEGAVLPGARILVPAGTRTLASDPVAWAREAATVWDDPAAWSETLGRERWGVAGAVTHRPPVVSPPAVEEVAAGTRLAWAGLELEVIALPAHSPYAVGFALGDEAVFCGDLLRHPGVLVDLFHLEAGYGVNALPALPAMLRALRGLVLPASGGPLAAADAHALAVRIEKFLAARAWRSPDWRDRPALPVRDRLGRWLSVAPGVWQMDQYGNPVLLIRPDGHALMVDPGPCDFMNPRRDADFAADLDRFQAERGLRTIDWALITHMHGDHLDQCAALRRRFGTRVAASRLVAAVISEPRCWPYPALLPWYGLGQEAVAVDAVVSEGGSWRWDGVEFACLHLPGHCHAHAGWLFDWAGERVALTGDVVQARGEAIGLDLGCMANHTVWDGRPGVMVTVERLAAAGAGLVLGGHGAHFRDVAAFCTESLARMRRALPALRALVPDGDLDRAMLDPAWPRPA